MFWGAENDNGVSPPPPPSFIWGPMRSEWNQTGYMKLAHYARSKHMSVSINISPQMSKIQEVKRLAPRRPQWVKWSFTATSQIQPPHQLTVHLQSAKVSGKKKKKKKKKQSVAFVHSHLKSWARYSKKGNKLLYWQDAHHLGPLVYLSLPELQSWRAAPPHRDQQGEPRHLVLKRRVWRRRRRRLPWREQAGRTEEHQRAWKSRTALTSASRAKPNVQEDRDERLRGEGGGGYSTPGIS